MADIRHLIRIDAPVRTVYRALTEQEGLRGWWTPGAVAVPHVGSIAEFPFGSRYHNRMRVVRLVPDTVVSWECEEGDDEWIGTSFHFELEPERGGTVLRFTHGDWRDVTDFFASCNTQWGYYMHSLKRYCETGTGTPYRGDA